MKVLLKKLFSHLYVLVVCIFLPLNSMEERRLPLTPVKESNLHNGARIPVTPSGKALRLKVARGVKRCIEGTAATENFDENEIEAELLTASPHTLTRRLRRKSMDRFQAACDAHGVTHDQINAIMPAGRAALASFVDADRYFKPKAPEAIESEFKVVAQKFKAAHFHLRQDPSVENAANSGTMVLVNPVGLKSLTELQRAAVYAHEITHGKNEDVAVRTAVAFVFNGQGKLDLYKAQLQGILSRTQETFADLAPAATSPTIAQGLLEYRKELLAKHGPGAPTTHPANDAWAQLDQTMVELHAKHKEELARKERFAGLNRRFKQQLEEAS
ncbi:hypothetical protein BH09DEP1_BH09DEP1_2660 [soil metagenome]